jgi:hypothetical protein
MLGRFNEGDTGGIARTGGQWCLGGCVLRHPGPLQILLEQCGAVRVDGLAIVVLPEYGREISGIGETGDE